MEQILITIVGLWFFICLGKFLSNKIEEKASPGETKDWIKSLLMRIIGGTVRVSETIANGLEKGIDSLEEVNNRISLAKKINVLGELLKYPQNELTPTNATH